MRRWRGDAPHSTRFPTPPHRTRGVSSQSRTTVPVRDCGVSGMSAASSTVVVSTDVLPLRWRCFGVVPFGPNHHSGAVVKGRGGVVATDPVGEQPWQMRGALLMANRCTHRIMPLENERTHVAANLLGCVIEWLCGSRNAREGHVGYSDAIGVSEKACQNGPNLLEEFPIHTGSCYDRFAVGAWVLTGVSQRQIYCLKRAEPPGGISHSDAVPHMLHVAQRWPRGRSQAVHTGCGGYGVCLGPMRAW